MTKSGNNKKAVKTSVKLVRLNPEIGKRLEAALAKLLLKGEKTTETDFVSTAVDEKIDNLKLN